MACSLSLFPKCLGTNLANDSFHTAHVILDDNEIFFTHCVCVQSLFVIMNCLCVNICVNLKHTNESLGSKFSACVSKSAIDFTGICFILLFVQIRDLRVVCVCVCVLGERKSILFAHLHSWIDFCFLDQHTHTNCSFGLLYCPKAAKEFLFGFNFFRFPKVFWIQGPQNCFVVSKLKLRHLGKKQSPGCCLQ